MCPACGARAMWVFYTQANVPASSNVALRSREQALSYPRGSLRLGLCEACGFISNVDFDPQVAAVAGSEESQGFSAVFREFARDLAGGWIQKYDLQEKEILEIGCGKGEFLVMMCELADGRGVGIDPAFVEGRSETAGSDQTRFVREPFSVEHSSLVGDAMVCRHTLEHIPDVSRFLSTIRAAVGRRSPVLLFELPDAMRVLREGAFWDVYYEHCSYFTTGSLARAFRAAGFDVLDVRLEYDGQYIIAECRPTEGPGHIHANEETAEECRVAALEFADKTSHTVGAWRARLDEERRAGRRVVLWGAGSKAVGFLTSLDGAGDIDHIVDINPYKHGTYLPVTGQEIVSPEALSDSRPDLVVIMNPVYLEEISRQLAELGVAARVEAVG
jgi:Methyltransferase domain/C-methyltransferase C-terminal domain